MHSLHSLRRAGSGVEGYDRAPPPRRTPGREREADRFIPNRSAMHLESSHYALTSGANAAPRPRGGWDPDTSLHASSALDESAVVEEDGAAFKRSLAANLLPGGQQLNASTTSGVGGSLNTSLNNSICGEPSAPHRVLAFKAKAPPPGADTFANSMRSLYSAGNAGGGAPARPPARHVPSTADRILDAPDLVDDYYLNLLSWSCADVLAIALGPSVYLWSAATGGVSELLRLTAPDAVVTSVSWIKEGGGILGVGTSTSDVQLWDAGRGKQVRSMRGHSARVGSLDWNGHVLTSGCRDGSIFHHDVRVKEHIVARLLQHSQEVCGLSWSPDGRDLASGGNDNLLCLWDAAVLSSGGWSGAPPPPRHTLPDHQAAVKALAWCPWQKGLLASGGGTADRTIKTWSAATGSLLQSVDTGSQVCSLLWSGHEKELLSSHGFSQNQLTLWKYPGLTQLKELTGHTARVLHMAASPDGCTVATAAADESLRVRTRGRGGETPCNNA